MFFGQYAWLDAILDAIEARIVATSDTKLSVDRVFDTLMPDEMHLKAPPADLFCTLTPTRFPADQGLSAGAGRYAAGFDGQLRIALFARVSSDQELRDSGRIKESSRGLLSVFLRLLDGLHHYAPTNLAGECLLKEPMRIDAWEVLPRRTESGAWAIVSSLWQVKFITNLPSGNA